jgi:hypothetical protein
VNGPQVIGSMTSRQVYRMPAARPDDPSQWRNGRREVPSYPIKRASMTTIRISPGPQGAIRSRGEEANTGIIFAGIVALLAVIGLFVWAASSGSKRLTVRGHKPQGRRRRVCPADGSKGIVGDTLAVLS